MTSESEMNLGNDKGSSIPSLELMSKIFSMVNGDERTYADFLRDKKIELKNKISGKSKLYLDTNFWNNFADAKAGSSNDYLTLYNLLLEKVKEGKLVCPVSSINFSEVLRQAPDSRNRVAIVFDELSDQIALLEANILFLIEDAIFVSTFFKEIAYDENDHLCWTIPGNIFGEVEFSFGKSNIGQEEKLRKIFYSLLECQKFSSVMNSLSGSEPLKSSFHSFAKRENELSNKIRDYTKEVGKKPSWKQIYKFSMAGNIIKARDHFLGICQGIGISPSNENFERILEKGCNFENLGPLLSSRRITSGIHAFYSHDYSKIYRQNDFEDFLHSCLALPYYDIFFTDKANANLLISKPLAFDKTFKCKVAYDLRECISIVENL